MNPGQQNTVSHCKHCDGKFTFPVPTTVLNTWVSRVRLSSASVYTLCISVYCLSNALHSSIGQNIKSLGVSDLRSPVSDVRSESEKIRMAITQQRVTRSPSCLVLGWDFRGRRIERRHFRLDQIQDGGRRPFLKNFKWP